MKKGSVMICFFLACAFLSLAGVSAQTYKVSSVLLKVSIEEGSSLTRTISISRGMDGEVKVDIPISPDEEEFYLEVQHLQGVRLSEDAFLLAPGDSKDVEVSFDSTGLNPGVYVGTIKIIGGKEVNYLPIIFEIESADVFFDVNLNIPPQYTLIEPGGKVVAQLKIFDLISGGVNDGLGASTINLEFLIYNLEGGVVHSESESVVVEERSQITKTIALPETLKEGSYVVASIARYRNSVGVSTSLIGVEKAEVSFSPFDFQFSFIYIFVLILLMFIVFLFVYIVRKRDSVFMEMKRYHADELRRQKDLLLAQEKMMLSKTKTNPKEIKREVRQKISSLKKKQKAQIKTLQHLRKNNNMQDMKRKIAEWKKQGYNTLGLEFRLKGLSVKEMQNILEKWKGGQPKV